MDFERVCLALLTGGVVLLAFCEAERVVRNWKAKKAHEVRRVTHL